jgi:iron(III) transport system substrate-binding protein
MRRRRQLAWVLGGLAAAGIALPGLGCGADSSTPSLILYNGQHSQLTNALVTAFTKRTGVQVEQRTNDGIVLADQLLQEGSDSPADIYLTENSPELVTLDQHHLLAKLDPSTLAQVPAADSAPTGDWVAVALRIGGLAYDPSLLPPTALPKSVLALAEPRWKGKIAIAPADSDFPPLVGAVIATYGTKVAQQWLAGLKRNAQIFQTDEAVVAAVNRGDVATGLINHYYWYRLRLEIGASAMHSSVYYFPDHDVGSIENISGAAVLASSAHKREAQRFVAFLVSHAGQEILAHSADFEYPARPGVRPNPALRPLSAISPATLGPVRLGNDQQAARLIEQSGLV